MRRFKYYLSIALVLLAALYCVRVSIFAPFIQKYIYNKTGYELKFDSFHILPFSLIFKNVEIDNSVLMQKINIKLNPIKIFTHIYSPINYIIRIDISKLEVSLSKNSKNYTDTKNRHNPAVMFPDSKIAVFIDEILIKNNSEILKITNADILINSHTITLNSILNAYGISIKLNSKLERTANNVFISSSLFTASDKIGMLIRSNGTVDLSSFNIAQNIVIEKLEYNGFQLNGSSGAFSKTRDIYNINLTGNFGHFEFNYSSNGLVEVKSEINIAKINKIISGKVNINFKECDNNYILRLNALDLLVFGFNCGNLNIYGTKNYDNVYNMSCIYGDNKKVEMNFSKNGSYELKLIIKNKAEGLIKGNIKTGAVNAGIKNIAAADIPIVPFILKNTKGIVNISGEIDDTAGHIDFKFKNFSMLNTKDNTNIAAVLTRKDGAYLFDFYKDDKSIVLSSIIKNDKIILIDFKFEGIDISNILYLENKISGVATGRIKYKKDLITEFDIKAFNGKFYGNKFNKLEAKGDANLNRINIEHFIMQDNSGEISVDVAGVLGFTDENRFSSLYINMKNINTGGIKLNGYIEFQGKLNRYSKIKGVIKIKGVSVSGVPLGNIYGDTIISTSKFELSNFKSDNGMEASLSANFKKNKISGDIRLKNTNIEGFYPGISGFLSSEIKFLGELNNPSIQVKASIKKGKYLSQYFSLSSELDYKNGVLRINKALLLADKTKVALKGNCSKHGHISLIVDNLTEHLIDTLIGFKTPVKGSFSGRGVIESRNGKQYLKMFLQAKSAYIKSVKLNDVKSNIEINDDNIIINSVSAKILDSEIKADKGFFNVKNGKYGIDIFLVNAHLGDVDLFGSINLSGKMLKKKNGSIYSGTVDLNNLWINRYKLSYSSFDYIIKDKTLKFFQKPNVLDLNNFAGTIIFGDVISVKELNISKDKTSFCLKADFSRNYINLNVKSSNIDWHFINDILNLPDVIAGNTDININLCGHTDKPKGNILITSAGGSIMEVPYDNLNIAVDFSDNFAEIKKVSIFKKNGINIFAQGTFPFWLDKTLSKKMQTKYVNIIYTIEDNKLNILKYLSRGYVKPRSGKISLKGSFTGHYGNISSNGRLLISGASFELKDYLDKVKDMYADISLIENLVKIDKFNFKSGNGKLNALGQLKLDNFHIKDFNIRIFTNKKGIFLRVPQLPIPSFIGSKFLFNDYSTGEPCFDIELQGTPQKNKISGWISIENTRFTFPGILLNKDKDSFIFANTEFDLELRSARNTRFENSFISTLINGSLYIKGSSDNLKVNGTIETSNGIIDYLGLKFDILDAKIEIIDENQIYITAEGETAVPLNDGNEFETVKLIIEKSKISDLSEKSVKFSSKDNPNMDSQKAFERVMGLDSIGQSTISKLETASNSVIKQRALRLIDQTLTTPLVRTILRRTKFVDNLRVSYVQTNFDISEEENPTFISLLLGTKYSLEKNLTNQFLLGYSLTFDDFERKFDLRHEVEMRFKLANNLFLNGSYELESETQFRRPERRLMLNHQIRFGLTK
ncbi:MAG: translocation/assembly module TamB [Endomicrobium sp.]|nr:translocation/assembly module TamB [Endomicrobium sp.]